ncbi:MAG: hypothetical protein ABSE56_07030 [Bryobacteraceae bacterium]|jgi:hypothetical protein
MSDSLSGVAAFDAGSRSLDTWVGRRELAGQFTVDGRGFKSLLWRWIRIASANLVLIPEGGGCRAEFSIAFEGESRLADGGHVPLDSNNILEGRVLASIAGAVRTVAVKTEIAAEPSPVAPVPKAAESHPAPAPEPPKPADQPKAVPEDSSTRVVKLPG